MTISVNLQHINRATSTEHDAGEYHLPFSSVNVRDEKGNGVTLFLPHGTGAAVAKAINEAIEKEAK